MNLSIFHYQSFRTNLKCHSASFYWKPEFASEILRILLMQQIDCDVKLVKLQP